MGEPLIHPSPGAAKRAPRTARRGYSLIETLMTVIIIQIISGMVIVNISNIQATETLSRAAQQVVVALRYARMLAMATGQPAGVEFDTANNTVRVYQGVAQTTVTNGLIPGGTYVINLNSQPDIGGVTFGQTFINLDASNPYQVNFGTLGGTANNGFVTLKINSITKTIAIPVVGDATVQ